MQNFCLEVTSTSDMFENDLLGLKAANALQNRIDDEIMKLGQ